MTLAPGARVGPYEIVAKLGEGGMGEVWRATDARLRRDVAIKVLPAAFVEDAERLARFEREAQVLAQLHHPNIASIFGLEDADGGRALVLELVEGPTLAERLEPGPLPLDEALEVAQRIAEALEEAHEKGIVHRDLKPQNIKVGADGKVKVLDFGLAKAMDPVGAASGAGSASQLAASPTLTLGATVQGVILGTAAYMAPEQAKGFPIDKRADVWAFGVVLYEMLTGARLFAGDSVADTLAGVLRAEIDLGELPPEVPPAVRRLLRRCLERKPKDRLHDIADARIVLDELARGEHGDERPAAADVETAPARRPASRLAAAVAAGVLVGLAVGWLVRPADVATAADLEVALAIPAGLSLAGGELQDIDLSANGRRQVATVLDENGRTQVMLRDLGSAEPRLLNGTRGAFSPVLSPDGESVAFVLDGALRRMPATGGAPIVLAESGADFRGASWGDDGFVYFAPDTTSGLMRVAENGGAVETVTELDVARRERTHRWPQALPGGGAVLFTCDTTESSEFYDDARIEAVRVPSGERTVLVEGSSQARFLAPDHLLFARAGTLFAIRFDLGELRTVGAPVPLLQGVSTNVSSGAVRFATSATGAAVWIPGVLGAENRRLTWIERDGEPSPLAVSAGRYSQLALSPDESRLVVNIDAGNSSDLWVLDLERGTRSRLTFAASPLDPVWSHDGRRIAYSASDGAETARDLFWLPADGSGEAEPLHRGPGDDYASAFSPEGRFLLFESHAGDRAGPNVLRLDLGEGKVESILDAPHAEGFPALSPDGRWLAYSDFGNADGGGSEILVRRFPELSGRWQVSSGGGLEPRWSPEGDAIFYRQGGALYRVDVEIGSGVVAGPARLVTDGMVRGTSGSTYAVGRGGRVLQARDLAAGWKASQIHYASDLARRARERTAPNGSP